MKINHINYSIIQKLGTIIGIGGFYLIFGLTAIFIFYGQPAFAQQDSIATQLTRSLASVKGLNMRAMQTHMQLIQSMPHPKWLSDGRLSYTRIINGHPKQYVLDPATGKDTLFINPKPESSNISNWAKPRFVRPGLMGYSAPVMEVPSPDHKWLAGTHNGNLWIRSAIAHDSSRFTTDGTNENSYDVLGAKWSPDSRLLALKRIDNRKVMSIPIVHWSKAGQPVTRHYYTHVGRPLSKITLYIIDRVTGKKIRVAHIRSGDHYLFIVGWSADGSELYYTRMSRFMKRLDLVRVDAATGQTHIVLTETSHTFIGGLPYPQGDDPQLAALHYVTLLKDGRFIWSSERDGWRRLYLYNKNGKLLRALTPTGSPVVNLIDVDQKNGWVYYVARTEKPKDPYNEIFYRVSLKGGSPQRLSKAPVSAGSEAVTNIKLSPGKHYFWVIFARIHQQPVMEVRAVDGRLVYRLDFAKSLLEKYHHPSPESFIAKAADGKTNLYGIIFKPENFSPAHKYPVLEDIYAGPQTITVPKSELDPFYWNFQSVADQGFIVVDIDARGTPGRGKAFQDAFYGQIGQHEIADHAAVLQEISKTRPYMDMKRVGVHGHSWGGYFTLRAMLQRPDLYKVGVAGAANADLKDFSRAIEAYMGCTPKGCPKAYELGSNSRIAGHLNGKLMLMHGTADEDVPFGQSIKMIKALEDHGKSYAFVVFPGADHMFFSPYWFKRMIDFFKENLR